MLQADEIQWMQWSTPAPEIEPSSFREQTSILLTQRTVDLLRIEQLRRQVAVLQDELRRYTASGARTPRKRKARGDDPMAASRALGLVRE